jgi:hypothetical protein
MCASIHIARNLAASQISGACPAGGKELPPEKAIFWWNPKPLLKTKKSNPNVSTARILQLHAEAWSLTKW